MLTIDLTSAQRIEIKNPPANVLEFCRQHVMVSMAKYEKCTFPGEPLIVYDLVDFANDYGIEYTLTPQLRNWLKAEEDALRKSVELQSHTYDSIAASASQYLYPYQRVGIMWIKEMKRVILGDSPGLGKSVQTIMACEMIRAQRVLVVCPSYVKKQWREQVRRWAGKEPLVIEGEAPQRKQLLTRVDTHTFTVVNYEMIQISRVGTYTKLWQTRWDAIIFDEGSKLQNKDSQTSKGAAKLTSTGLVIITTGTPIWNKPDSIWHLLHILDPKRFTSYWNFVNTFCTVEKGIFGANIQGPNEMELERFHWILSRYMIRRRKDEVITDLPDKRHQVLPYQLTPSQNKLYSIALKQFQLHGEHNVTYLESSGAQWKALRQICNHPCLTGADGESAKDKLIRDLLEDLGDLRVIIFVWHKDYAEHLANLLSAHGYTVCMHHGGMTEKARDASILAFRRGDKQILIGTLASMNMGIDLFECHITIYAERDWLPSTMEQSEDRTHRHGQKNSPLYIHLYAEATVEQYIYEASMEKKNMTDRTLATEDVLKRLLTER